MDIKGVNVDVGDHVVISIYQDLIDASAVMLEFGYDCFRCLTMDGTRASDGLTVSVYLIANVADIAMVCPAEKATYRHSGRRFNQRQPVIMDSVASNGAPLYGDVIGALRGIVVVDVHNGYHAFGGAPLWDPFN